MSSDLSDEALEFLQRMGEDQDIWNPDPSEMPFQLTEVTDRQLMAPEYRGSSGMLYVTQSSCEIVDEFGRPTVIGKCHRQLWYKKKGFIGEPWDAVSLRRMNYGVWIEDALQDQWKKAGIYVQNNVKLRAHEYNVSGEIDAIVFDTAKQHPVIVEVKSGYGYTFNKNVFGKSNHLYPEGMPHMDYIMQVMWYLHLREKIEQVHGESPYALIYYIDRADCRDKQFVVELSDGYEGEAVVKTATGKMIVPNPNYSQDNRYCKTDAEVRPIKGLTMERIIDRFAELEHKLAQDEPPEREYFLRYPEPLADDLFQLGQLSKSRYDQYNLSRNEPIGDFKCAFCDFSEVCYPQGAQTDITEDGKLQMRLHRLTDKQAEEFIESGELPNDSQD